MIDGDVETVYGLRAPHDEASLMKRPETAKLVAIVADQKSHQYRRDDYAGVPSAQREAVVGRDRCRQCVHGLLIRWGIAAACTAAGRPPVRDIRGRFARDSIPLRNRDG